MNGVDDFGQPTAEAIESAWRSAIQVTDIDLRAQALINLWKLREAKTTWFGAEENRLRVGLDAYLRART